MVSVNAFLSAFLHLFLRAKGAVLKASLVKLFCKTCFFLATLATFPPPPPPPTHNIFHGGFLTLQPRNGIYFAPAPQNHVNDYAINNAVSSHNAPFWLNTLQIFNDYQY